MRAMLQHFFVFALATVSLHHTCQAQCYDQIGNGTIGVYADAAGTQPCIIVPPFTSATLHVIAKLEGQSIDGLTSAEFRLEFSNTAGYFLTFTPNPLANLVLGSPTDDNPAANDQGKGLNIAFTTCQPNPIATMISIGTYQCFNAGGGACTIRTKRHESPSSPTFRAPLFTRCDDPLFSKVPLTPTEDQLGHEPVNSISFLNTPSCPACPPPPPTAPLGIYADSTATNHALCVESGGVTTFHLIGVVPNRQPPGVTGAEFRIEVADPTGYVFIYNPPQGAQVFGNPFDLTPNNPNDATGCTILFPSCQPGSMPQVNDLIGFGTIGVFNQNGGATEIRIRSMQPPGSPSMPCPRYFSCDAPFNTPVCMTPVISDDIVFSAVLNEPSCLPAPFVTEHLELDLHDTENDGTAGPVSTTQVLHANQWFLISVQGTGSLTNSGSWISPPNVLCGVPERTPMTASPGVTNFWVGADAEFNFAAALPNGSNCSQMTALGYPTHHSRFVVDLGGGFTDLEPHGGPVASAHPGHLYRYLVQGTGSAARFAWQEPTTSDDYGVFQLTIEQVDPTSVPEIGTVPQPTRLLVLGNLPDPFNPTTEIRYVLPSATSVQVDIFDIRGRLIRRVFDGHQPAGTRSVRWDGRFDSGASAPSGSYLARIVTPLGTGTERMTLLK